MPSRPLLLALLAVLAPAPWGLASAALARLAGEHTAVVLGLALLGLSRVGHPPEGPSPGPASCGYRILGRWREPPGAEPGLESDGRFLKVRMSDDLAPPTPGSPVEMLLRPGTPPRVVACRVIGPPTGAWADRWLASARRRARRLLGLDARGLVEALVLGRRDSLGSGLRADCIATGTSHLLALSGLHVSLLVAALSAFGLVALAAPALVLFVILAGAGAPLVRAALGFGVGRLLELHARAAGGPARLAFVALLMECWRPGWLDGLSARLSFLAVAGLVGVARLVPRRAANWLAPAGALLGTLPLLAETFGCVQPLGLLVTPLLVPAVAGLLVLGLALVPTGDLLSGLDGWSAPLLGMLATGLRSALDWLATALPPPLALAPPPVDGALASLAIVVGLFALGEWRRRARRRAGGPAASSDWERLAT